MLLEKNKLKLTSTLNTSNIVSLTNFPGEDEFNEILTDSKTIYTDSEGSYSGEQLWVGQSEKGYYYFFRHFGSCEYCDSYMSDFGNFSNMNDEEKIRLANEIYDEIYFFADKKSMKNYFEETYDFDNRNYLIKKMLDIVTKQ